MDLKLSGRSVLVTGASRGIGAAVARAFASEGAGTLHLVSRTEADAAALAAELTARSTADIRTYCLDVADPAHRERLHREAGPVDVLVNNAGAVPPGSLDTADLEAWRTSWELKVWGYLDLTRRYLATMAGRGGVIVNNIGVAGERPDPDYVAGSAANAALVALTRAVGSTSLDHGVRVVGVNPGLVETDRVRGILEHRAVAELGDADAWPELIADRPGGRLARAGEVADAVVFLASDRSSYTSGCVLTLDGGFSARGRTF